MTQYLYGQSSENITLAAAINCCLSKLNEGVALVYSPQSCQFLKLENDGNLYDSKGKLCDLNYQNNPLFEVRIFNPDYELRWLNEKDGKGIAVIISELEITNCLENNLDLEISEVLPQQYLLWGEKAKTTINQGWQRLSAARIGSLDVVISQPLSPDKRAYLKTREYLKVMDKYGNVCVAEERLIKLEVA